jgi:uncharacterized protein YjiS (DUF1127 family)
MTLTTHRSLVARSVHAASDLAARLRRALQAQAVATRRVRALHVLEDAALRDMGLVRPDFAACGAIMAAQGQ